jgi:hypothetical protein
VLIVRYFRGYGVNFGYMDNISVDYVNWVYKCSYIYNGYLGWWWKVLQVREDMG